MFATGNAAAMIMAKTTSFIRHKKERFLRHLLCVVLLESCVNVSRIQYSTYLDILTELVH
jgi:hypothetical protein